MARPAKAIITQSRHNTKSDVEQRLSVETALKGDDDKLTPPERLTESQKEIFIFIVNELSKSGILGNLDIFVLENCAIAIDRLRYVEGEINKNRNLLDDGAFSKVIDRYTKIFFRCCNELSLSPQARAKIGALKTNNSEPSEIEKLIKEISVDWYTESSIL